MQSLRMVHIIEGRPAASAELMRACLVNRAGHRIDVVESRQDRATLAGVRRDTGAQAKVTWTIGDAQRAKLTGNPAWAKYPRSMLLALSDVRAVPGPVRRRHRRAVHAGGDRGDRGGTPGNPTIRSASSSDPVTLTNIPRRARVRRRHRS